MTQNGYFQDKVVLVTGAAAGIGRATALEFARRGVRVALADLNEAGGQETFERIQRFGGEGFFRKTDVSHSQEVEALIRKIMDVYGRLDFAHNNAGIEGKFTRVVSFSEEEWDQVINVNLKSVWLCMKYEIPAMHQTGSGAIVNTSSIAGVVGLRKFGPYSASKHGIIGLTKTAALEYGKEHIRVNAICPGLIDTAMIKRNVLRPNDLPSGISGWVERLKRAVMYQFVGKDQPSGRMGTPEEVAQTVVWLCSEESAFINGTVLPVDGAYVAK